MKIKSLFLTVMASAAMLFGCTQEIDLGPAKLEVDTAQVTLSALESSQDVTFLATRDWMVTGTPDWMAVSPASGEASTGKQVVRLSVNANDGYNRKAELVFTIGFARSALLVTQEGPLGEKTEGNGSKEDPYTVAGVISYVQGLGADVNSPEKVYIKGKVSRGSFTADSYGNGTFYVSDDGSQTNEFYAYRVLYLGNAKFTANDTQINPGDDVVIYGNVVNYRGSTPETVQNSAFLYSLNGVNKGGDEGGSTETGEAKGTGTLDDPFNVAAAIAKAVETGTNETADMYYIKGKVATITEQFAAQFGNATFTLVDEGSDAVFTAYRVLYFGNQKWTEGGKTIAEGDEVILHAKIVNFRGNTPETVQGSSYVYSINGEGGGDEPTPPTPGEAQGTGTFDDPFNVAAAIAKAKETGETATADSYYIKGLVTGTPELSGQYKNATIQLVDVEGGEVFTAFRIKGFGGADITGNEPIKAGDELVVFGQIVNYKGNTPETTQGGQLVLWNGQTSFDGDEPTPPTPGEGEGTGTFDDPFNVAAAIAMAKSTGETATADSYYIKGLVTGTPDLSGQYKNATIQLVDVEGGEVFTAFRIKGFGGADITGNEPIKAGDELVVFGQIVNYKGNTPETTQGGQLVLWNGQTSFGGDEPGPQPGTSYETDLYKIINLEDDAAANFEGLVAAVSTNSFVVTDCTTHVYVFKPANMAVIGDKVQVSGTKTTYGGVPEIASGAAVNVVSNDNAIPYPYPDDITDYFDRLANSFSKTEYITFTGTLAKNGNYYNVAVSGSNYVGSISNPVTSLGLDNLDGKEVKVTGFFVGISGSNTRYVNVVATEVKLVNEDNPDDPTGGNDDPTGGNDDPTGGNDDPADDGDFVSNLAWEPGANAYTQTAVVNGEEEVEVLKLGTSSKYGDATLMSVTGAPFTKIEFYAISWNNAPVADLVFSTDGEEVTVTPLANTGLKNNPPYTLTVTADDKYEVEFETAVTSVSVKTSGGYRAVLFGINAE